MPVRCWARWMCLLLVGIAGGAIGCDDVGPSAGGDGDVADLPPVEVCEATGEPPQPETCDGRDNDCDGRADEGFDLANDPEHCGGCNAACDFGNYRVACANSTCELLGCPPGFYDRDGDPENGCEAEIQCTGEPSAEMCDGEGRDEDCDGRVDENFDLMVNVLHCGACNSPCRLANATPFCDGGRCRIRRCDPGYGNPDGDESNGCEPCAPSNPGPERCDGEDNDCDGLIDEDFDLETDPEHCGGCGERCAIPNAAARCIDRACVLEACDPGLVDRDGEIENGCEAECAPRDPGPELCDGQDNDCDGQTDEGYDLATDPENCGGCGDGEVNTCRLPNTVPTCTAGRCTTANCEEGFVDRDGVPENGCEEQCPPIDDPTELCDGEDNDCDGRVDEETDLDTDVAHCGRCGVACDYDNATGRCESGRCALPADGCDPGWVNADQDPTNGCEYQCTPSADGIEVCNERDDDCDTFFDEGFDVFTDLDHCGGCDQACVTPNAIAVCNIGVCEIGGCDPMWFDVNGEVEDGCEYDCPTPEIGPEMCDGVDNDCNGQTDEIFDLTSDVFNCGACDNPCLYPNGRTACVDSACRVEGCLDGWYDANGDDADGCEYRCVRSNGGGEVCDTLDNDCDGAVDEETDLTSSLDHCGACNNACAFDNAQPRCVGGRCALGNCNPGWADVNRDPLDGCEYACPEGQAGGAEFCNEVDDDCDGAIDEGFDLLTDIENCGACEAPCDVANANPFCSDGACRILSCLPGAVDLDDDPANGCECRTSEGAIEICDGLDNDCNGVVDDPDRVVPPPEVRCLDRGVCRGVAPTCVDAGWTCAYGEDYELNETRCDGGDNDCDGRVDEAFEQLGRPCSEGEGICRDDGRLACDGPEGIACTAEAQNDRMRRETCNGLDDDCDGVVDENSDIVVNVPGGGGVGAFSIYVYEASRTDATDGAAGQSFARACSKPDVLPWVTVRHDTAAEACAAAGMRLCTAAEWQRACAGPDDEAYPYGDLYVPDRCNGADYDTDPDTAENEDDTLPTGALPRCSRDLGGGPVFDLSGNVWEWIAGAGQNGVLGMRGGSAGNIDGGLTCGFQNAAPPGTFRSNIGFRCCGPPR